MAYTVRNYSDSDFERLVEFSGRASKKKSLDTDFCPEHFLQKFRRPGYNVYSDFFVTEEGGVISGFADVVFEHRIGRAILNGYVLPQSRRQGVGRTLVDFLLKRSQNLGARSAQANVLESNQEASPFLLNCGFSFVRFFLNLHLDISGRNLSARCPEGIKLGRFKEGEEADLARLQNKVFSGSWGFCPNTVDEIQYYLALTGCRINDVLCLEVAGQRVGYSWYHSMPPKSAGARMRIHMFGVAPEFQGKGYGKILLRAAIDRMQQEGAKSVELTVDEKNATALALYDSFGFSLKNRSLWYEKKI